MVRANIVSTGMAVPDRVLNNFDLEKIVDTSDQWIRERTGMFERHLTDPDTAASDLAVEAANKAMQYAGCSADELDAILVATISGDYVFPATACIVQHKLGIKNCMAMDLSAACSGYVYGLSMAQAYIQSGMYKNILLIGVDCLTKVVDWSDRGTCVLFGDGAGASLIQPHPTRGVVDTVLGADGATANLLYQPCGGSKIPISNEAISEKQHFLFMNGREIFKHAVRVMAQTCLNVLEKANKSLDDVSLIIPHQANMRIIEAVAKRLGVSMDQFFVNVHKYANTSAATIPMALYEAFEEKRIQDGDLVLFVSFGGGLTWGASLVQF